MLEKIAIVLVEPREPGNIGAAARAMANMGLSRLVLVRPPEHLVADAFKMALAARPILEAAVVVDDLAQALAGFGFVAGTTRRSARAARPGHAAAARRRTAGRDGRERRRDPLRPRGQRSDQRRAPVLPAARDDPLERGVRVAQPRAVGADDRLRNLPRRRRTGSGGPGAPARRAPTADLEGLYAQMERVLLDIGYLDPANPAHMMRVFRRLSRSRRARRARGQGAAGDFPAGGLVRRAARRTARGRERRRSGLTGARAAAGLAPALPRRRVTAT